MENVSKAGEKQVKAKRQIRNYLIDSRFQLRWVFRVTVVIAIIVLTMGYFIYRTVADATDQMVAQKIGNLDLTAESFEAFKQHAESDKMETVWTLAAWLFALVVMLGLATIVFTHKIAGPVYKMRKVFTVINGDSLHLWDKLRRGDELQEAFEDFGDMLSRLREHRRKDTEALIEARDAIAGVEGCEEAREKLDQIISRYQESVKIV